MCQCCTRENHNRDNRSIILLFFNSFPVKLFSLLLRTERFKSRPDGGQDALLLKIMFVFWFAYSMFDSLFVGFQRFVDIFILYLATTDIGWYYASWQVNWTSSLWFDNLYKNVKWKYKHFDEKGCNSEKAYIFK